MVELWPYAQRSRGIGVQQFFGKLAGFFSTNVNPVALDAIKWKFLAIYCGWIFFEFLVVFFLYPETSNRTLEELAFRKFSWATRACLVFKTLRANWLRSFRGRGVPREDWQCGREEYHLRYPRQLARRPGPRYEGDQDCLNRSILAVVCCARTIYLSGQAGPLLN